MINKLTDCIVEKKEDASNVEFAVIKIAQQIEQIYYHIPKKLFDLFIEFIDDGSDAFNEKKRVNNYLFYFKLHYFYEIRFREYHPSFYSLSKFF